MNSARPARVLAGIVLGVVTAAAACGGAASNGVGGAGAESEAGGGDPKVDGGGAACTPPKRSCSGACTDTTSDERSCGACGAACATSQTCFASKCVVSVGYAVRRVFLGDTDRAGVASKGAWQLYGQNIDGLVTTKTSTDVCTQPPGASPSNQEDGPNGIDNAWGKVLIPLFQPFAATPSRSASDAIEAGGRTPMLVMPGYARGADTAAQPTGFVFAEKAPAPAWDGSDVRKMALAWTNGRSPNVVFPAASVTAGAFVSGSAPAPLALDLPFGSTQRLHVPLHVARFTMRIAEAGITAAEGILTGVVATKDMQDAMAKAAGSISVQLCSGSTLDSIEQTIAQASDIMMDGTNAPGHTCDAISFGIGFEAVAVTVSGVGSPDVPSPDPCNP